jgi:hypothetical protein
MQLGLDGGGASGADPDGAAVGEDGQPRSSSSRRRRRRRRSGGGGGGEEGGAPSGGEDVGTGSAEPVGAAGPALSDGGALGVSA